MSILRRMSAECAGTFWLVFGGCGSAIFAAAFPAVGIGILGVSFAFGLALLTAAYTIGPISGCHINPAVTVGLCAAGRFPARDVLPYIAAQVVGSVLAAVLLTMIVTGMPDYGIAAYRVATNGFAEASPAHASAAAAFIAEFVLTAAFLVIIVGATCRGVPLGFAPIAIGLALTLIHLISVPITNTSVNPARSTGPALVMGGIALAQLWMFWAAPLLGGAVGGLLGRILSAEEPEVEKVPAAPAPPAHAAASH